MPLNIAFEMLSPGILVIHVNQRLQNRGNDLTVYANTGYTPFESDALLLAVLLEELLTERRGVLQVHVSPYQLKVYHSKAVPGTNICVGVDHALRSRGIKCESVKDVSPVPQGLSGASAETSYEYLVTTSDGGSEAITAFINERVVLGWEYVDRTHIPKVMVWSLTFRRRKLRD